MTQEFAPGLHLLIDHYGAQHLRDAEALQDALEGAAWAAGAVVIGANFHSFPDRAGVTGVVLLAESHISIHTWPELEYAAIDVFMCGAADADQAAEFLKDALLPERVEITRVQRNQRSQPSL